MSLPLAPLDPDTSAPPAHEPPETIPLHEAYEACVEIARRHYENFPVLGRFLTPQRRLALAAIYAFARRADDLADASAPTAERLGALDALEAALLRALEGAPEGPVFVALSDAIDRHALPVEPFLDLLAAFRDDARNRSFETWDDLLGYCRGSANPVGRLVLLVHGIDDPHVHRLSDHVCTALQLTNFWQDLGPDLARGRLFVPAEDLRRFGLSPESLARPASRAGLSRLITHECRGTEELYLRGLPIARSVPYGLAIQLRVTVAGGRAILSRVERAGWRVLRSRPTLGLGSRTLLLGRALIGLDG